MSTNKRGIYTVVFRSAYAITPMARFKWEVPEPAWRRAWNRIKALITPRKNPFTQ